MLKINYARSDYRKNLIDDQITYLLHIPFSRSNLNMHQILVVLHMHLTSVGIYIEMMQIRSSETTEVLATFRSCSLDLNLTFFLNRKNKINRTHANSFILDQAIRDVRSQKEEKPFFFFSFFLQISLFFPMACGIEGVENEGCKEEQVLENFWHEKILMCATLFPFFLKPNATPRSTPSLIKI